MLCAFDANARQARTDAGFPLKTKNTIATAEQFELELRQVRKQGYGRARDELMPNLSSLAAPVLDVYGVAQAAISILGSTDGFDKDAQRLSGIVVAAGRRLSHAYQHRSARPRR